MHGGTMILPSLLSLYAMHSHCFSLLWIVSFFSQMAQASYAAWEDVSWAIWDVQLSSPEKQALYDDHIQGCRKAAGPELADVFCYVDEFHRMQLNMFGPRSMRNYTSVGFAKLPVPRDLWDAIHTFWQNNRNQTGEIEWTTRITPYHNHWDSPPTFLRVQDQKYAGGGPDLAARISSMVREKCEDWTGQVMAGASVYGIRIYHNNSILAPHVDRIPLVTSAIINVDQDLDEPWPLEVYDHDGVAHNITMKPGEMILYESHSTIHGRPFPMRGRFFANIFVHFEVLGDVTAESLPASGGLPPYLIPGSSWEPEFWKDFPAGWQTLEDITSIVIAGDLRTLRYIVQRRPHAAHLVLDGKTGYSVLHEAIRAFHVDIVQFLVDEMGVDVNLPYYVPYPVYPLDLAYSLIQDKKHPMFNFLLSRSAELSPVAQKRVRNVQ